MRSQDGPRSPREQTLDPEEETRAPRGSVGGSGSGHETEPHVGLCTEHGAYLRFSLSVFPNPFPASQKKERKKENEEEEETPKDSDPRTRM